MALKDTIEQLQLRLKEKTAWENIIKDPKVFRSTLRVSPDIREKLLKKIKEFAATQVAILELSDTPGGGSPSSPSPIPSAAAPTIQEAIAPLANAASAMLVEYKALKQESPGSKPKVAAGRKIKILSTDNMTCLIPQHKQQFVSDEIVTVTRSFTNKEGQDLVEAYKQQGAKVWQCLLPLEDVELE